MIIHVVRTVILFQLAIMTSLAQAATVTYTDKLGRTVDIQSPVRQAVFLQMYELLPVMDIWDKVAGVARYAYNNDLIKAARPDIANFPSVGSGADVNMEAMLKLKPDLVITWAWRPEMVRFMEDKGLRVIAVYPETLSELYEVMDLLGRLFQEKEKIAATRAEMESIFAMIRQRAAQHADSRKPSMVFLGGKPNKVSCGIGINNELMSMIGGSNIAKEINQRSTVVSLEQMVAWNPEIIFIWGNASYSAQDILANPQWRHIRAVRQGRVYKLPEWSVWSPMLALAALWMAKKTYPEDYRDIDLSKTADSFYRRVFSIPFPKESLP